MTEELRSVTDFFSISLELSFHADHRVMVRGMCRLRVGLPTALPNVADLH
jgi:hypothetical protein